MRRPVLFVLMITAAALLMGWFLDHAITFVTSVLIWILLLVLASGAEDPNPIRTAAAFYAGIPDEPMMHRVITKEQVRSKDRPQRSVLIPLIISALVLTALSIYWLI